MTEVLIPMPNPKTGRPFRVLGAGSHCVNGRTAVRWLYRDYAIIEFDPFVVFETHPCCLKGFDVEVVDGPEVLLEPKDQATFDKYEAYAVEAVGILGIFDVTLRDTMEDMYTIIEKTQELRRARGLEPLPFAVIGTILEEDSVCVVTTEEGRAAAEAHGAISYAEGNVLLGNNIRAAIKDAAAAFVAAAHLPVNDNGGRAKRKLLSHGCTHQ